jgi:hypothetical protein
MPREKTPQSPTLQNIETSIRSTKAALGGIPFSNNITLSEIYVFTRIL